MTSRKLGRPRRAILGALGLFSFCLLFPALASAHGIVGKADLPIPVWLFSWAAAIVLVVSLVALSSLWTTPQLQREHARRAFSLPLALEPLGNLLGLAANFSVTFIYVVFWVGLPLLSVVFGDIFKVLSPWRSAARALLWIWRRLAPRALTRPPLGYPPGLGMWPAVLGLVGFGWLELVYLYRDTPSTLAALSAGYFTAMVLGMMLFGVEEWGSRADSFGAYFNLISGLSALEYREGAAYLRRPLSGITGLAMQPGTAALIYAVIGITTFDGLSNGGYWKELASDLVCARSTGCSR